MNKGTGPPGPALPRGRRGNSTRRLRLTPGGENVSLKHVGSTSRLFLVSPLPRLPRAQPLKLLCPGPPGAPNVLDSLGPVDVPSSAAGWRGRYLPSITRPRGRCCSGWPLVNGVGLPQCVSASMRQRAFGCVRLRERKLDRGKERTCE